MSIFIKYFIGIGSIVGVFLMPLVTQAQRSVITPASAIQIGGNGASIDWGVSGYPDAQFAECSSPNEGCLIWFATSSPYTILSFAMVDYFGAPDTVNCGGVVFPIQNINTWVQYTTDPSSITYNGQIHCSTGISTSDVGWYAIQYVPYDTRLINNKMNITSSTSTPLYAVLDMTQINIAFAILFFMLAVFFFVWSFRRN